MSDPSFLLESSECLEPELKRTDRTAVAARVRTALMEKDRSEAMERGTLPEPDCLYHEYDDGNNNQNNNDDTEIGFQGLKGIPPSKPLIEEAEEETEEDDGKKEEDELADGFQIEAATVSMPPMTDPPPTVPPTKKLSGRTESTHLRLRRQGFTALQRVGSVKFAMRSTRRGSDDWQSLIEPFVADLAFRSLVKARHFSEPHFCPYLCHGAVLFVDLSGYSRITTCLAHNGAHAISAVVNAYLERLLNVIRRFGGDCIKFAGDALLVVWEGTKDELPMNVFAATKCVLKLQQETGVHPIEGTDLVFRIHCGLACGVLDSEVFEAPTHVNMQRLYHNVSGRPMEEIGDLVDLARCGETCVSEECIEILGKWAKYQDVPKVMTKAKIIKSLSLDDSVNNELDQHITRTMADRMMRRSSKIEEEFIHPNVLRLLSHGGKSPTQIAQMRHVCVLFIAMVANGSSINWLMEVQRILDRNRCPIVQIIDDDKGVHLVAAINLYEAIPESAMLGLNICEELQERQVGCAIGMAQGSTFCGVTGSSTIACRWDITGPPAVRAARLMQYAIKHGHEMVIDHSIFRDRLAANRLILLQKAVQIKGTQEPCPVYTLSGRSESAALRILETENASVHDDEVHRITDLLIEPGHSKRAIIITGPALAGKKIAAQRAAGYGGMTPYLHVSSESAGYLQLAGTIATWFRHVDDADLQELASDVLKHLHAGRWSRAHDACVDLMNLAVLLGLKACFVVDRVQFLDEFSFSLIRECFRGRRKQERDLDHSFADLLANVSDSDDGGDGGIFFLCIHVNLYRWSSAQDVKDRINRSHSKYDIPIVPIGRASLGELKVMCEELIDASVSDRWLKTYCHSSGFCAGYFVEKMAACRAISARLWVSGKKELSVFNDDLELEIPVGMYKRNRDLTVNEVSADVAMKFTQTFDELPPLFQTFLKVLTFTQRGLCYELPVNTAWSCLNDLIAHGVDKHIFQVSIKEMREMFLIELRVDSAGKNTVSLFNPAMADIVRDVCTPEQIASICLALSERLKPMQETDFRIPFLMADFYYRLEEDELMMIHLWKLGYRILLKQRNEIPSSRFNQLLECIDEEIASYDFNPKEVLGTDFFYPDVNERHVGMNLLLVKDYIGPVSFAQMGHTLTAIARSIFHEAKVFCQQDLAEKRNFQTNLASACRRYCKEALIVENFLRHYNLGVKDQELEAEFELVMEFARHAENLEQVQTKASLALDQLIPRFIESRRERLLQMVMKVRQAKDTLPQSVVKAEPAVKNAFNLFLSKPNASDGAHEALMCLAVHHWKPKLVPETIPLVHRQTIARIRNKVLRRQNDADVLVFRHRQGPDDLGAFLIITPLLYQDTELREWYR